MDLDTIKKLMKAMEERGITRVSLKEESGFAIELERSEHVCMKPDAKERSQLPVAAHQSPVFEKQSDVSKKEIVPNEGGGAAEDITSPLVGTFYVSPSPEDPPFVNVGDVVKEGTILCIIEAMKVMNEVKAGKSGKILEVCVDNGSPVEFGTKLFRIG